MATVPNTTTVSTTTTVPTTTAPATTTVTNTTSPPTKCLTATNLTQSWRLDHNGSDIRGGGPNSYKG